MNLLQAHQLLKKLEPLFFTHEAASVLGVSNQYASVILTRLEKQNIVVKITRGKWAYSENIDPLLLPNFLAFPMKAYISLHSALYYRGLTNQIPSTIYAVTNGKTRVFKTKLGLVSLHNIHAALFTGYDVLENQVFLATTEKALFDTLYFAPTKSHLFSRLTEIELPEKFNVVLIKKWISKIQNKSRKKMVENRLREIIGITHYKTTN